MNQEAINKRIQALESELAGLKAELNKPSSFTFCYEKGKAIRVAEVCVYDHQMCDNNRHIENFRYRQLNSNAQADFKLQKELMCIGALAEQIDPEYKSRVDWNNHACRKYHISYDHQDKVYYVSSSMYSRVLGVVFIPQEVATQVCEILNNKGVEL